MNSYADLYNSKSYNCNYYHTSISEVKSNEYKVDSERTKNFAFSIVNIDLTTKKSLMVGTIRNPYLWYLSFWKWSCKEKKITSL